MLRFTILLFFLVFTQSHSIRGQGSGFSQLPGKGMGGEEMFRTEMAVQELASEEMPSGGKNNGYWVYFKDKPTEGFDPFLFFDPKAIERRLRHGQCLYDPIDIPVSPAYLETVSALSDSTCVVSRWLNAVFVYARPTGADRLAKLPFVRLVELAASTGQFALLGTDDPGKNEDGPEDSGHDPADREGGPGPLDTGRRQLSAAQVEALRTQIDHMQGRFFADNGFDGNGIRIALFDGGFPGVDTHPAFEHLRAGGRIRETWDFHRNRSDVYRNNAHGTMVLSMITGIYDGHMMGLATGADFLLARTEIRREPFFEEKYWLAAAEWADRLGADIINSSLGYIYHRYFPEEMDGQTSLVAQAARIATRKGILVVNAAGNERENARWRVVITPADVDSVMSVGAVSHPSMLRASYSSVGPAADGSTKPNLVAMGNVVLASSRGIVSRQGTSFAAPLVTGFAACLWEKFPGFTNMELFEALQRSGSLYPYFDYSHGYGVPGASVFFEGYPGNSIPTFDLTEQVEGLMIHLRTNPLQAGAPPDNERYLYYQVLDRDGRIVQYFVVMMEQSDRLVLDTANFVSGQKVRFHFEGYTASWVF
jgi:serine protease AprX